MAERPMTKVQYGTRIYYVPEQVKKDADDLFDRWSGTSARIVVDTDSKPGPQVKELQVKLGALKGKVSSLPKKIREKYFF